MNGARSTTYNPILGGSTSGPTSFAAAGGNYMKRTQYATMNDNMSQRISENAQFVQLHKQMQQNGSIPWGNYAYPS